MLFLCKTCCHFVFHDRFNFETETPTTNFDNFPSAIMTVFQVRTKHSPFLKCLINIFKCNYLPYPTLNRLNKKGDISTLCVCVCRFWQVKTGMQWCTMGLSLRAASHLGCSTLFTLSFLLSLETVSFSYAQANTAFNMRFILGVITRAALMRIRL